MTGGLYAPALVANSVLQRTYRDASPVTLMKLQRVMFVAACAYQRLTGEQLMSELFQPWRYGPVLASIHQRFHCYHGEPITDYALDANGYIQMIPTPDNDVDGLFDAANTAIDLAWAAARCRTAVELSRIIAAPDSAYTATISSGEPFISAEFMARDTTLDRLLTRPQ